MRMTSVLKRRKHIAKYLVFCNQDLLVTSCHLTELRLYFVAIPALKINPHCSDSSSPQKPAWMARHKGQQSNKLWWHVSQDLGLLLQPPSTPSTPKPKKNLRWSLSPHRLKADWVVNPGLSPGARQRATAWRAVFHRESVCWRIIA